ncbi:MAG: dynamin family protein [Vulcanimicrobiaceae bacterium]
MDVAWLGQLEELAISVGEPELALRVRVLREQFDHRETNVLVVGRFKRGKSTFINALVERDVLPVGVLPVTGVVTAVHYGDIRVRIRMFDGSEQDIPLDDVARYVSESENPKNCRQIAQVDIWLPTARLRNVALVDTPGIGSTFDHNSASALQALAQADVAILVVGPEPPVGRDELEFVHEVVGSASRLFVVFNKMDLAGSALPELMAFTQSALAEELGKAPDIAPLSAAAACAARQNGEVDENFQAFGSALDTFLALHGSRVREESGQRRVRVIIDRLRALLAMRQVAASLPAQERERRRQAVEQVAHDLDERLRALGLLVADDARSMRTGILDRLDERYRATLAKTSAVAKAAAEDPSAEHGYERARSYVLETGRSWRQEVSSELERGLGTFAVSYGVKLAELERAMFAAGCQAFGIAMPSVDEEPAALSILRHSRVLADEPATGLELIQGALTAALPSVLRTRLRRSYYERMLASELDAARGRLHYAVRTESDAWVAASRRVLKEGLDAAHASVLAAFSRVAQGDCESPDLEVELLNQTARRLEALSAEFDVPAHSC